MTTMFGVYVKFNLRDGGVGRICKRGKDYGGVSYWFNPGLQ
jgi:hypothetical protein